MISKAFSILKSNGIVNKTVAINIRQLIFSNRKPTLSNYVFTDEMGS